MARTYRTLNTRPIDYYGRFVDQSGSPVPNVKVPFDIGGGGVKPSSGEVRADQNGYFAITGYHGAQIWLKPQKEGYHRIYRTLTNGGSRFSLLSAPADVYKGSPTNPAVLRLWKLKGAESLIAIELWHKIPTNLSSESVLIDVVKGKTVDSGGDMRVTVTRTGEMKPNLGLEWRYSIVPVDGEIRAVEREDFYEFGAPSGGYSGRFDREFGAGKESQMGNVYQVLFLISRNHGVFTKLMMELAPPRRDESGCIRILKGIVNANGSPNWEEDGTNLRPPE